MRGIGLSLVVVLSWVLSVFSVGTPEQISLNYGTASSEMVVMWAVKSGSKTDGRVEYGSSPSSLTNVAVASSASYSKGFYSSPTIYTAVMTDLQDGNKEYYYRVGSQLSGYSAVYKFKSHPGVSSGGVTFHIMGDPGMTSNTNDTFVELLAREHSLTGLSGGIINMGDLSYANGVEDRWDDFGRFRQFMATEVPMFTTLGNHEYFEELYSLDAYTTRFNNPAIDGKKELFYSSDIGLVHWVMVAGYCAESKSSRDVPCLDEGTKQRSWLISDLASVDRSKTPWVIVVFHQPYMNSNTHHDIESEGIPMQRVIEDILLESKVDIVLAGHVHAYERTCQAYKFACVDGAPYYITIGDGGNAEGLATPWVEPQPSWSLYRQASYGSGDLTVYNATHAYWQWHQNEDLTPTIADSFWYVKGSTSSNHGSLSVTKEARFVEGVRGIKAAAINEDRVRLAAIARAAGSLADWQRYRNVTRL